MSRPNCLRRARTVAVLSAVVIGHGTPVRSVNTAALRVATVSDATASCCQTSHGTSAHSSKPHSSNTTASQRAKVKSNDACYVCHMPFLKESLATTHAKAKIWCGTCHGPSVRHIENENIGATPPDVVYKKGRIGRMCGECHKPRKHPKLTPETRSAHLAKGKKAQQKIKGRTIEVTGVCTDCHGRHWIPPRDQPVEM